MKAYVYLLLLLALFSGCKSNHSLQHRKSETLLDRSKEKSHESEHSKSQTTVKIEQIAVGSSVTNEQTISAEAENKESKRFEKEETEIDIFDINGSIKAKIRHKKQSGTSNTANKQNGSETKSSLIQQDSLATKGNIETGDSISATIDVDENTDVSITLDDEVKKKENKDSRVIQGSEWLYLSIIIISAIILWHKTRKKGQ